MLSQFSLALSNNNVQNKITQYFYNDVTEYEPDAMLMAEPNMGGGLLLPVVIQTISPVDFKVEKAEDGTTWFRQNLRRPSSSSKSRQSFLVQAPHTLRMRS